MGEKISVYIPDNLVEAIKTRRPQGGSRSAIFAEMALRYAETMKRELRTIRGLCGMEWTAICRACHDWNPSEPAAIRALHAVVEEGLELLSSRREFAGMKFDHIPGKLADLGFAQKMAVVDLAQCYWVAGGPDLEGPEFYEFLRKAGVVLAADEKD